MPSIGEVKASEFDEALNALNNRVAQLGGDIVQLRDKLEPFLRPQYPQPPDGANNDPAPSRAPILDRLSYMDAQLVERLRALEDILARLVV